MLRSIPGGGSNTGPRRRDRVRMTQLQQGGAVLKLVPPPSDSPSGRRGEGGYTPREALGAKPILRPALHPGWVVPLPPTLVDLPTPEGPTDDLEAAIDLLRRAAQSETVSERGDALLFAIEHASRALADLFDRETAQKYLDDVIDRL